MQRNSYIDFSKGILICLVAIGHAIQYPVHQNEDYLGDGLFKFIYMFHMPLFMALAGYVSCSSINRLSFPTLMRARMQSYVIPIFAWAFIYKTLLTVAGKNDNSTSFLLGIVIEAAGSLWFLWALLGSLAVTSLASLIGRLRLTALVVAFGCVLLLPEVGNIPLFKYTFPFFIIGFTCASADFTLIGEGRILFGTFVSGVIVAICYFFWDSTTYIYVTGMSLSPENLNVVLFRYFASLAACIFVSGVLFFLQNVIPDGVKKILETAGRDSIFIYIIQGYVFVVLFKLSRRYFQAELAAWVGQTMAILIGVSVAYGCWVVGHYLTRIDLGGRILFGKVSKTSRKP